MHANAHGYVCLDSVGQTIYCVVLAGIHGNANAAMLAPISASVVTESPYQFNDIVAELWPNDLPGSCLIGVLPAADSSTCA